MLQGVKWLCTLIAMSCNSAPGITDIQSAYEREAYVGSPLHDNGLQVLKADCHPDGIDIFLCEIRFISKGDPERPYFDIATVARAGEAWELTSGLCKHEAAGAPRKNGTAVRN
jgi:hypothetical protein